MGKAESLFPDMQNELFYLKKKNERQDSKEQINAWERHVAQRKIKKFPDTKVQTIGVILFNPLMMTSRDRFNNNGNQA